MILKSILGYFAPAGDCGLIEVRCVQAVNAYGVIGKAQGEPGFNEDARVEVSATPNEARAAGKLKDAFFADKLLELVYGIGEASSYA